MTTAGHNSLARAPRARWWGGALERSTLGLRLWILLSMLVLPGCRPAPAPTHWGVRTADWVMARWTDPWELGGGAWEYNAGIVLAGIWRTYQATGDARYAHYVRRWVDHFVDDGGAVAIADSANLDLIQPGVLLLALFDVTGDDRYRVAAWHIAARLSAHPRNDEGGLWHKDIYPHEMWLDSAYMAGVFCVRYARVIGRSNLCPDDGVEQALLLARHSQDPRTGLLRHAWDADANAPWADPATGLAPVVWCRGLGWYAMALVEMLEDLPPDHPRRDALHVVLRRLAGGVARAQDPQTGLWYQVVDQPTRDGNWIETSGSAMLIYALQRGVERGLLPSRYGRVALRGWRGLCQRLRLDDAGSPVIADVVEGMGVQLDYDAYTSRARLKNSTHGLAAVMLAASVMEGR